MELWRDSEPDAGCVPDGLLVMFGRGDTGTEFKSGAMVSEVLLPRVDVSQCLSGGCW